jgi:hypothetical protein
LDESTFDPIVTVYCFKIGGERIETLGRISTYQRVEGRYNIVEVVVGDAMYSRDPCSQMWLEDEKLCDEYPNWGFEDSVPEGLEEGGSGGKEVDGGVEGAENVGNGEEDSPSGSFVVSTSEIGWGSLSEGSVGSDEEEMRTEEGKERSESSGEEELWEHFEEPCFSDE